MNKKMLIVDGNSILNRAFYGIRPLTTRDGLPTNAVYGMINMISARFDMLKPEYVIVAFDEPGPTFRHEKFEGYKANRHGMPSELAEQLPYAKTAVSGMGYAVLSKSGYEADDILGTMSKRAADAGIDAYILTGDRDSLQLIGDHVNVLLITRDGTINYNDSLFMEKYGVTPHQYIDVKALMGDSSDNIPGVAGIGEKTAFKLIADFGSLDALYEKYTDADLTKSVKTKLEAGHDMAYTSRFLAEIDRNVPYDFSIEDAQYNGADRETLIPLLRRLEFTAMIKKFDIVPDTCEACEKTDLSNLDILEKSDLYGVAVNGDTLCICDGKNTYCMPLDSQTVRDFFSGYNGICVYDYKSVLHMLDKLGIEFKDCHTDVLLAAYVADASQRNYALSELAYSHFGEYYDVSKGDEAATVLRLARDFDEKLDDDEKKLLRDVEIPLAAVLARMEQEGFKIDRAGLESFSASLDGRINELTDAIYDLAGCTFNLNSPKQLGEVLFEKLEIPCKKKTKTGYSTDAEILDKLRPYYPIVDLILQYRQVAKLQSTYAVGLLRVADEHGRIHSSFNQTVTATGRLSSSEPNLQNIPIRTELGREMRRFFVPESEEYVLIDADYSQIELRLLAAISGDETMTEAFLGGEDIHTATAAQVFGVERGEVTPELRKRAKAVNFGIVYGIGGFSLAQDIGVTKKEAGEYIESYLSTYPRVKKYLEDEKDNARRDGYVKTMFGRKRFIPELRSSKKNLVAFGERVAMNSPIQGSAADIIKIAMVNTDRALKKAGLDARLILTVHDELIIEANRACAEQAKDILRHEMEHTVELSVPLTVEVASGSTWYDAK